MDFGTVETPALVLDAGRLQANAARMAAHCDAHGVFLRPHVKTAKSVEVALVATGGRRSGITVSTLKEAEHFACAGFDDILYAVGITPNKFERVRRINRTGRSLILLLDSVEMARAVAESDLNNPVLIEIDCGEHRGGMPATSDDLIEAAQVLRDRFKGLMTHAGHSYATDQIKEVRKIARDEVTAAVGAAERLRATGLPVEVVSIGSTPTVLHAETFEGVTEVRAGIYLFGDLCQFGRNICGIGDIAMSVLSTVIGHNRAAGVLTLDAGALALSKDIGAKTYLPSSGYGWLCDAETLTPLGLSVDVVHQEHGSVGVSDPSVYDRHPIGSLVRILPGHACLTAAAGYGKYHLLDGREWPRLDGWD